MSKTSKNGRAAKGGPSSLPDVETVKKWVLKDLEAAHYCLGLVLMNYPEVVNQMAANLHDHIMKKEQGAGIDHVKFDANRTPAEQAAVDERLSEEAKGYADS